MELTEQIKRLNNELTSSIKMLRKNGTGLAQAEREYKIKVHTEALKLRDEKMPVTMIDLVIYGVKDVAELRLKRDIAQTIYNANQEHINATKLQIRILESQLSREWGAT